MARHTNRTAAGAARSEVMEGRTYLVVPVVMARASVVMNGGLVPVEEMVPHAWNGVPVTVDHPTDTRGESIPLNEPGTLPRYAVGTIFNARVDGESLVAEAWIDVARANRKFPGLVDSLRRGEKIDVSTGYFCDPVGTPGTVNGVEYQEIHRNLRPEHLALLPGAEGACSWADGCGVRAANSKRGLTMDKKLKALASALDAVLKSNECDEIVEDPRQMVADLISHEDSPFGPDDQPSLEGMTLKALRSLHSQYAAKKTAAEGEEPKEEPAANEGGDEPKEEPVAAKKNSRPMTVQVSVLSDEDREAIAELRQHRKARRADLVATIKANSTYSDAFLAPLSLEQLAELEAGIPKGSTYARPAPAQNSAEANDELVKAMTRYNGTVSFDEFRKARGAK